MNHPLFWAFRKWKMQEIDAKEKLKNDNYEKLLKGDDILEYIQSQISGENNNESLINKYKANVLRYSRFIENLRKNRNK